VPQSRIGYLRASSSLDLIEVRHPGKSCNSTWQVDCKLIDDHSTLRRAARRRIKHCHHTYMNRALSLKVLKPTLLLRISNHVRTRRVPVYIAPWFSPRHTHKFFSLGATSVEKMILNEKNGVLHRARARVPLTARPFDLLYFLFFAVSTSKFGLDFTLT